MTEGRHDLGDRVLVLMPSVRDAERTATLLVEAAVDCVVCEDLAKACHEIRRGVGALLLTDDIVLRDTSGHLAETLRAQPNWSSVPILVIAREGATQVVQRAVSDALTSLIVVERPVRPHSLVSVVLSALRGRRHQYQNRDVLAELAAQAEQLRTNDRRKDEFLAMLAHELRNPLAPVRTGLDVLQGLPQTEETGRVIGVMARQVSHMVRLIDDLLDVSRISRGKLALKKEAVTLGAIIDTAVEAARAGIASAHHTLELDIADRDLCFAADGTRLAQVVGNLLNNASKYTPPGGTIRLSAHDGDDTVTIAVKDTGAGVAPDRIDDIFDMFSQADTDLPGAKAGLGIGLALVRRLVELHGGEVHGESPGLGLGSTFTVTLPAKRIAVTPTSPTVIGSESESPRRQRILIVDDNTDAADLLSVMLEQAGYTTAVAYDSRGAFDLAEELVPDIAILDIGLPEVSGYDIALALRKNERFGHLGLIALTGLGSKDDKRKAAAAGFDVHLTKPVDRRRLREALLELGSSQRLRAH